MKTITKYKCDFCGKEFNNESECKKCEKTHRSIVEIESTIYEDNNKHPLYIRVKDEDGEIITYRWWNG